MKKFKLKKIYKIIIIMIVLRGLYQIYGYKTPYSLEDTLITGILYEKRFR